MSPQPDDDLPPRAVLDAWDVPAPPSDLEDKIMNALPRHDSAAARRRPSSLLVPIVAGLAAAALVLVWLAIVRTPSEPSRVEITSRQDSPAAREDAPPPAVAGDAAYDASATLVLRVNPDSATVEIDGETVRGPGPFIATALGVGAHSLVVRANGKLPVERTLVLPAGTTEIPLELSSKLVSVAIDTVPASATLKLRTEVSGEAQERSVGSFVEIDRDPSARYTIVASATAHRGREVAIDFDGTATQRISIVLAAEPRPAAAPKAAPVSKEVKTATLKIGTAFGVAPAKVHVDGRYVGVTPIVALHVTAGRHSVEWKWPDGKTVSQTVSVEADQTKVLKAG